MSAAIDVVEIGAAIVMMATAITLLLTSVSGPRYAKLDLILASWGAVLIATAAALILT